MTTIGCHRSFKILGKKVVMDTFDALRIAEEIKPKVIFPMHYGFLKGTQAHPELMLTLRGKGMAVWLLTPGAIYLI